MVDKISNKILCFLVNKSDIDDERREILLFGITRIVEDIPKTVGIILIGILLNIIFEMVVVTIIISLYKTFVGGVHAKTNCGCFIFSAVFYLAIIYLAKLVLITGKTRFLFVALNYIFAIYCIWTYAPADVPEIPKVDKRLRRNLKIQSFIMLNLIFLVTYLFVKDLYIQRIIAYSVLFINLMTTRTIYRLFKNEYGHEVYIPDEI